MTNCPERLPGALLLVLAALLAGCSGEADERPGASAAAGRMPPARPEPIWFIDVSSQAGLTMRHVGGNPLGDDIIDTLGSGGAVLDYDLDGDPDLYLAQGATRDEPRNGPPDVLYRNDGDRNGDGVPEFTDVTEEAGLGDRLWSFGVAVADFDNDADPDIYLLNWGPNRLYRNDGGRFTDVAEPAGVADERWGASAAWSDVDRDGDLDLYVANYVEFAFGRYPARGEARPGGAPPCNWRDIHVMCGPRGLEPAAGILYVNDGDTDGDGVPDFHDGTVAAGMAVEPRYALACHFFDADDDGDDELYVANDSLRNTYFVNQGDGRFEETAIFSGVAYNEAGHEQAGMGIATADYDGDGRLDIAVTNFSHDHHTLYHNDGDHQYFDVSFPAGIGGPTYLDLGWGISFVDFDQDGWPDLFMAHGHVYPQVDERDVGTRFHQQNVLFRNRGDGTFEDLRDSSGPGLALVKSSRAALPFDLDGDGDQDVLVTSINDTPDLLRNEGTPGHWIEVRLRGKRGNRDGVGARVHIEAAGRRQIREIRSNAGYAGAVAPVAHFGLGTVRTIDRLEVRWPSGARVVQEGVEANRRVVLDEPDAD